jgi:two-component system, chemotaxis family, sensor kinase CheA
VKNVWGEPLYTACSMDSNPEFEEELLEKYLAEAEESLSEIDGALIQLEKTPSDLPLIQSIFRAMHSLKGNSAFFGFVQIKALAHEMESVLDRVCKGEMLVTPKVITAMLNGVDLLHYLVGCQKESPGYETTEPRYGAALTDIQNLVAEGIDATQAAAKNILESVDQICAMLPEDAESVAMLVESIRAEAIQLQSAGGDEEADRSPWPQPYRDIKKILEHPIEGALPQDQCHRVRAALARLKDFAAESEVVQLLDDLLERYDTIYETVGFDELLQDIILEQLAELDRPDIWNTEAPSPEIELSSSPAMEENGESSSSASVAKSMRIPESQIDLFLSYVGELLVVGDMFNHLQKESTQRIQDWEFNTAFKVANDAFTTLSDDLQASIMAIRKVPVGELFSKFPRITRDIATLNGKEIELEVDGSDLEIDKSLIELLDASMTHLIRNAADHGIEMPEDRERSGKPRAGTIRVSARDEGNLIAIAMEDDGQGIDLERVRVKAVEMGYLARDASFDEETIIDCMFRSGLSTASKVTEVSGRGVGMDVVKNMIDNANGKIHVDTRAGEGTTFTIRLPKSVTTRIIQGFLVESGGINYVLPMNKVLQASSCDEGELSTVAGRGKCIQRHDKILPFVSLKSLFDAGNGNGFGGRPVVVTVVIRNTPCALEVDKVLGVQKVVFRSIRGIASPESISGGALMGDGSVALILDVDKLMTGGNHVSIGN